MTAKYHLKNSHLRTILTNINPNSLAYICHRYAQDSLTPFMELRRDTCLTLTNKTFDFLWVSFYHCHHHNSLHLFSFIQSSVI